MGNANWILFGKDAGRVARSCYMAGFDRVERLSPDVWIVGDGFMEPTTEGWGDVTKQKVTEGVSGREYSPIGEPAYFDGLLFGYFGTVMGLDADNHVKISTSKFYVYLPAEEMVWDGDKWCGWHTHAIRMEDR